MGKHRRSCLWFLALLPFLLVAGCASDIPKVSEQPPPLPPFPPQKVMVSGDYAAFLAENQNGLKGCAEAGNCDVVLFNLGFLHAYSGSPYCSQAKALGYFKELIEKHPQSPWAFQAKGWVDILERSIAYENKCRQLQGKLKSRNTAINELQKQMERSREIDVEMDRRERELLQ